MSATVNGTPLLRASVLVPACGIWVADVEVQGGPALAGDVTLVIGGETMRGNVAHGGPYQGRSWFRVVGGKGGWDNEIEPKSYRSEFGVRLTTVLDDAAREAGETLGTVVDRRVGPAYVRPKGTASRTLDALVPGGWYVDSAGVTQIGARPVSAWKLAHQVINQHPSRRSMLIAAEDVHGLYPGVTVDDMVVGSVRHELTPDGLRTHLSAADGVGERLQAAMTRVVRAIMGHTYFHRLCEYRVSGGSGGYVDLQPADSSLGLPPISNVPIVIGIPGGKGAPVAGSRAYVAFVNGVPTRPVVVGFEGEAGPGYVPASAGLFGPDVKIGDAAAVALAKASVVSSLITALSTFATGLSAITLVAQAGTLVTTLAGLPSPATTKAKGT